MESRAFIDDAKVLIDDIQFFSSRTLSNEEETAKGQALQKRITNLFNGLQNPTLPSAYRLRDAALATGFYVDPKHQHRLAQFENLG